MRHHTRVYCFFFRKGRTFAHALARRCVSPARGYASFTFRLGEEIRQFREMTGGYYFFIYRLGTARGGDIAS